MGAWSGQGAIAVAAALALLSAGHHDIALVSADPTAMAALLGIPLPLAGERPRVVPSLSFKAEPGDHPAEVTVLFDSAGVQGGPPAAS